MARTAKTETVNVKKVEVEETKYKSEQETQMEILMKQMAEMQKAFNKLSEENEQLKKAKVESTEELTADTDIAVVNECANSLTLSTDGKGSGNIYRFYEFGEIQDISWGDLKEICKNMPTLARGGAFYIVNKEAVKKLRLDKYYDRLLTNNEMETLLDRDANSAIELYKLASDMQKENIIDLVMKRKEDGVEIDANVLIALQNLSGKNLTNME